MQQMAKDGELPKEWRNIWNLVEADEEDPGSVDWSLPVPAQLRAPGEPADAPAFTPPFTRPDREAEMTHAYNAFAARIEP